MFLLLTIMLFWTTRASYMLDYALKMVVLSAEMDAIWLTVRMMLMLGLSWTISKTSDCSL